MSAANGHTPTIPGVAPDVAHERGYVAIQSERQLDAYTHHLMDYQRQIPGLLIPIYRLGMLDTYVLRPDKPRINNSGATVRYEWPQGHSFCLDILPCYRTALSDTSIPIWITEGAKKADALASIFGSTIVPININGVWGWRKRHKDGSSHPLPDFDPIALKGRRVVLAFDNDVTRKAEVQQALRALAKFLKGRGASVQVLILSDDDDKIGVDDAIARGMTADELRGLVQDLDKLPSMSQAQKLLSFGFQAELFQTPDGEPYAWCQVHGHREAYSITERGGGFRNWLIDRFYDDEGRPPSSSALAGAMDVLRARAMMHGKTRTVHTRFASHNDRLYLDLVNDAYEVVEIDATGWRIKIDPPVVFRRAHGALPLPHPVTGGSLGELRSFLNLSSDDDWLLIAGWLLAPFLPTGAYPHLAIDGEQGSAKTTTTRMLRALVDPSNASARSAPKDEQDLAIAARNALIVVCDNASKLSDEMSDALCRLSTGAAFTTRKLYTDDDEMVLSFKRPVILNGITEFITRGDLADRTIMITLRAISETARADEDALWRDYESTRPRLLGALLDAVSTALRNRNMPRPAALPRMADFALWVERAAPQLGWRSGAFIKAYRRMRNDTGSALLEASPVAPAVLQFARDEGRWVGTATELLDRLNKQVALVDRPKGWPGTPRGLGDALRRIAPSARTVGVVFTYKETNANRLWTIEVAQSDEGDECVTKSDEGESPFVTPFSSSQSSSQPKGDEGDDILPSLSVEDRKSREETGEETGKQGKEERSEKISSPSSLSSPSLVYIPGATYRAIWHAHDGDISVTITGDLGIGADGHRYCQTDYGPGGTAVDQVTLLEQLTLPKPPTPVASIADAWIMGGSYGDARQYMDERGQYDWSEQQRRMVQLCPR